MRISTLIIVTVAFRMQQLGEPLLSFHAWRQCDTAAIARNFYRNGINILWPQIDWAGPNQGYVGTEFPLYQAIIALLYNVFGLHDSVGRVVSVLFSIGGVVFVYLLVCRLYDFRTGFVAAAIFSFMPLNLVVSQQFMPDAMMLSLALGALYCLYTWYREDRLALLYASSVLFSLALLVKVPAATYYLPIAYIFFLKYRWSFIRKWYFWIYVLLTVVPAFLWYHHAIAVSQQYYPYHMFGAVDESGRGLLFSNLAPLATASFYTTIGLRVLGLILTPAGLLLFIIGIADPVRYKDEYLLHSWLLSLFAYLFVFAYGNFAHSYYQILLAPVCAVFIAKGILFLSEPNDSSASLSALYKWLRVPKQQLRTIAIGSVVFFLVWTLIITRRYFDDVSKSSYLKATEVLKQITAPDTLVITSDGSQPVSLYLSDRKGWAFPPTTIGNGANNPGWSIAGFEELVRHGGKYFLVMRAWSDFDREVDFVRYMNSVHEKLLDKRDFIIYKLNQ